MALRLVHIARPPANEDDPSACKLCGLRYGIMSGHNVCDATICLNCGSRQCMVNGLGSGHCRICYIGLLAGWSGDTKPCGYARCERRAVASIPRVRYGCRDHVTDEPSLMDRIYHQFDLVDDAGYRFGRDWADTVDVREVGLFRATDADYRAAVHAFAEQRKQERVRRWERGAPL